jgi:hypothetical protein
VPYLPAYHIAYYQQRKRNAYYRKSKIKTVESEPAYQSILDEILYVMGEILKYYGTKSGQNADHDTRYEHELPEREMPVSPYRKTPQSLPAPQKAQRIAHERF